MIPYPSYCLNNCVNKLKTFLFTMPRRCCIPACKSNYDSTSERVKTFQFPKEKELYDKWIKYIPRRGWTPTENSVVCIKHFSEDCIITSYLYNYGGKTKTFFYDKPHLNPGSCPTIFSGFPKYLNQSSSSKRKTPDEISCEIDEINIKTEPINSESCPTILSGFPNYLNESSTSKRETPDEMSCEIDEINIKIEAEPTNPGSCPTIFSDFPKYLNQSSSSKRKTPDEISCEIDEINIKIEPTNKKAKENEDNIENYEMLLNKLERFINTMRTTLVDKFIFLENLDDSTIIYKMDFASVTCTFYVKIDRNLCPMVVFKNKVLCTNEVQHILKEKIVIDKFSKLQQILEHLSNKNAYITNIDSIMENIEDDIELLKNKLCEEGEEEQISQITFLREQISLAICKQKRYSSKMLMKSFLIYMQSKKCYEVLRSSYILTLPHSKYLQQLIASLHISSTRTKGNKHFLNVIANKLTKDMEKWVVLQLNEVYAENSEKLAEAKTVVAFLISGIFTNYEHVVQLCPLKTITGQQVAEITKTVILLLEDYGFRVLCISTANSKVNEDMFSILKKNSTDEDTAYLPVINHPIFLGFDSVHIIKNIRNDWLNMEDVDKTFHFPKFNETEVGNMNNIPSTSGNSSIMLNAKFGDLRNVYKLESTKIIKKGLKLNDKTVYPSNLERQKVSLALNVFHESTQSALLANGYSETANFIEIIWKWWSIINIQNCIVGKSKNNPWANPFQNIEDERLIFLQKFIEWVEKWNSVSGQHNPASLTKDTRQAIVQTTRIVIKIIKYSLQTLKVENVLPGKFQTDKHFSM